MAVDPPRLRATRRGPVAGRASRSSPPVGCRPRRRHGPDCRPNSSHHAREAGRIDRSGRSSRRRCHGRWPARATGPTQRAWRPSRQRLARKPAPPGRSAQSEGISATAGASANPSPSTSQLIMLRVRCRDWVPDKLRLSTEKSRFMRRPAMKYPAADGVVGRMRCPASPAVVPYSLTRGTWRTQNQRTQMAKSQTVSQIA
jgi:hypothetical protein